MDLTQQFQKGSPVSYWLLQGGPIITNTAIEVAPEYITVLDTGGGVQRSLRIYEQQITNLPVPVEQATPQIGQQPGSTPLKVPQGWSTASVKQNWLQKISQGMPQQSAAAMV